GKTCDPRLAPALVEALDGEPDAMVRGCIVNAIGHLDNREVVPALLALLADTNEPPAIRGEAAEAIGHLDALEGVGGLTAGLGAPEADVGFWSAFALGRLGAAEALPPLRRLQADETIVTGWWSVGVEATDAIANIEAGPSCPIGASEATPAR